MRILNSAFNEVTGNQLDLYPTEHRAEIDSLNETIYETVNDGVYRAGFATSQHAYETAVLALFKTLDELDDRLATRRFLFGPQPLETDWRLFVTLIRFDAVYHGHFKCNVRRILDYRNLYGYLRDLYQQPGIAETVNFDHIKTALLLHARRHQPDPNCADRAEPRFELSAWERRSRVIAECETRIAYCGIGVSSAARSANSDLMVQLWHSTNGR